MIRPWHALSPFQQVMALWESVRPYNFAHVFRLRGPADAASLQEAVRAACRDAGLGVLVLDGRRYRYEPAEDITLGEMEGEDPGLERFWKTVAAEIDRPFPAGPHHPIRWWVRDDPANASHLFVAVYRHLVADAAASCLLVGRALRRYYRAAGDETPLIVHSPDHAVAMAPHYRRGGRLPSLLRAARRFFRLRRVYRLPEARDGGEGWGFHVLDSPPGLIGRLVAACRNRGITVNEAFLAALCAGLASLTPRRRGHRSRRGLALAHVVNVRGVAGEDLSRCFGVHLGTSATVIEEPDAEDFGALLGRIVREVRRDKAQLGYAGRDWNFWVLTRLNGWPLIRNTRTWYRKVYPLSAGVSNFKVDPGWFPGVSDRILDCISIVPPGPALPIVLFPTTVGERLNVCLVHREACLTGLEAQALARRFFETLGEFAAYPAREAVPL